MVSDRVERTKDTGAIPCFRANRERIDAARDADTVENRFCGAPFLYRFILAEYNPARIALLERVESGSTGA
jgi:hypothetical protein